MHDFSDDELRDECKYCTQRRTCNCGCCEDCCNCWDDDDLDDDDNGDDDDEYWREN